MDQRGPKMIQKRQVFVYQKYLFSKEIILSEVSVGGSPIMSATLVLDEKYNNQKLGLCSDSGFPQIADNSDTSCLGIGGRRLSAFDLIYCDTILGRFRICI